MFAWRLMLADGGAQYADLIERTLYNVVATSPAADGRSFYYANTLHQRVPGIPADPHGTSLRASLVAARPVVRGVVLPDQRRAHLREPDGVLRDGG